MHLFDVQDISLHNICLIGMYITAIALLSNRIWIAAKNENDHFTAGEDMRTTK